MNDVEPPAPARVKRGLASSLFGKLFSRETTSATEAALKTGARRPAVFHPPQRHGDRWGYLLGPKDPPKLPRLQQDAAPSTPSRAASPDSSASSSLSSPAHLSPANAFEIDPRDFGEAGSDTWEEALFPDPQRHDVRIGTPESHTTAHSKSPTRMQSPQDFADIESNVSDTPLDDIRPLDLSRTADVPAPLAGQDTHRSAHLIQLARDLKSIPNVAEKYNLDPIVRRDLERLGNPSTARPQAQAQAAPDSPSYRPPADPMVAPIVEWYQKMTPAQRAQAGGLEGYAKTRGLDTKALRRYVDEEGRVLPEGAQRLKEDAIRARDGLEPSEADVTRWQNMPQNQRDRQGMKGFARRHGLRYASWAGTVQSDGSLTVEGAKRFPRLGTAPQPAASLASASTPAVIGDLDLLRWRNMTTAQRGAIGGAEGYVMTHGLDPGTWRTLVNPDGFLTPAGESLVNRPGPSRRP